jgi:hypothetical protein
MTDRQLAPHRPASPFFTGTTALVIAVLLGSLTGCATQPRLQEEPLPAEQAEEHNEYLASRGFYQRRAASGGWFLDRPSPEFRHSRTLSSLLKTVPGLNASNRVGGAVFSSNRQQRSCHLAVYVDGTYTSVRNVDELTLDDIEALEVYRGPSEVPLTYRPPPHEPTCGAVLVWSRMQLGDD